MCLNIWHYDWCSEYVLTKDMNEKNEWKYSSKLDLNFSINNQNYCLFARLFSIWNQGITYNQESNTLSQLVLNEDLKPKTREFSRIFIPSSPVYGYWLRILIMSTSFTHECRCRSKLWNQNKCFSQISSHRPISLSVKLRRIIFTPIMQNIILWNWALPCLSRRWSHFN